MFQIPLILPVSCKIVGYKEMKKIAYQRAVKYHGKKERCLIMTRVHQHLIVKGCFYHSSDGVAIYSKHFIMIMLLIQLALSHNDFHNYTFMIKIKRPYHIVHQQPFKQLINIFVMITLEYWTISGGKILNLYFFGKS